VRGPDTEGAVVGGRVSDGATATRRSVSQEDKLSLQDLRVGPNGNIYPVICTDTGTTSGGRGGRVLVTVSPDVERTELVLPVCGRGLSVCELGCLDLTNNDSTLSLNAC
jgi:hypothetical protein